MRKHLALLLLALSATTAAAHEGHVALPTRGASVNAEKGTIVLSRESREALGVESVEILTSGLPDWAPASVTLVSPWASHAFASSRLSGRITSLLAAPGASVKAGEPLAEIESFELENLNEELLQTQSERRLAERLLESLRESGGAVAGQGVLEAETTLEQQRNAEVVGRLKWRSLGLTDDSLNVFLKDPTKRVRRLTIAAPISGRIIHADVSVGRIVEPGEHLFEIVDLNSVWAKIGVLERDLDRVRLGGEVELRMTARRSEQSTVRIDAIGPALDGPGRTATAWATIQNLPTGGEPLWLPGMRGQAKVFGAAARESRVVPVSALVDDGVSRYVLVEEAATQKQSEYRRKEVEVVRRTAKSVEVRSASLFPGDRVVSKGAQQLGGFFVPGVLKLSREASASIGLQLASVERRSLGQVMEVDGVVDLPPEARAAASAPLGGNILRLHVERAKRVKRGELLAEVQSNQFQTMQLELLKEELGFQLFDHRAQVLAPLGEAVPRKRRLEVEAAVVSARNRRDAARRRLEMVGLSTRRIDELVSTRRLADSVPVVAPIDGVVVGFDKALGQVVRADEPLFTIFDSTRPLVRGLLLEREVGRIAVGQIARVRFASDSQHTFTGRVVRTGGTFSSEDQSLEVWVELGSPPSSTLRQGQLARIALALDEAPKPAAFVVPPTAIVREGNRYFAFVQKSDRSFERRPVTVGGANDQYIEVLSGLSDGETIAVRGAPGLQTAHASVR